MAISSGSFAKQGGWGQPVTIAACLPYEVTNFPWATYLPTAPDGSYYNDPAQDGITLNLNLGGYSNSWIGAGIPNDPNGVYTALYSNAITTLGLDAGVVDTTGPETTVDLWRYSQSFPVSNSTVVSRYLSAGGSTNGATNPTPGYHQYPGLASLSSYDRDAYIQARNFGQPVIFELWYSLNMLRTSPLNGYNNYTFYGNQRNVLPSLNLLLSGAYAKKYQIGILRVNADMYNLTNSDFIAGMSYVGNQLGGVINFIVNGAVVQTKTVTKPVIQINYNSGYAFQTTVEATTTQIGTAKSAISEMFMTFTFDDLTQDFVGWGPFYLWNDDTSGAIDTYLTKFAWIIDSETGGLEDQPIWGNSPPSMYTAPNAVLSCAPTSPVPNYTPPPPIT